MKAKFFEILAKARQQSLLRQNIFFNVAGTLWSAVMQFAFVPVFVHLLGIESYGLIAFSLTIQALLAVMEMGLAPAMNFELARLKHSNAPSSSHDFVRSCEIISWCVSFLAGSLLFVYASAISSFWIKAGTLSTPVVEASVKIMGGLIACQLPQSLYTGGLLGLQRHAIVNILGAFFSTVQNVGAIVVLLLISPSIKVFFIWRFVTTIFRVLLTRHYLVKSLPESNERPRFNPKVFQEVWKFAAGMSGITVSAIILTQFDKFLLSKLLPLSDYGLYMLAAAVANVLTMVSAPLFNSFFPLFTGLVAQKEQLQLRCKYRLATQLMTTVLLPPTMIMVIFSHDLLLLWTGSQTIANSGSSILSILSLGVALNGLMLIPFALQLAHGQTRLSLNINIFLVCTMIPLLIFMAVNKGVAGVASVWLILNAISISIGVPMTHRTMLPGEFKSWFMHVFSASCLAIIITIIGKSVSAYFVSKLALCIFIIWLLVCLFFVMAMTGEKTRSYLLSFFYFVRLACIGAR